MQELQRESGGGKTRCENGAPTDGDGNFICYRACSDGSPCHRVVPLPRVACYTHWE